MNRFCCETQRFCPGAPAQPQFAVTDTNVIQLAQPETFSDSLTEILRNGARALLTQAVETEVADFLVCRSQDRGRAPARRASRAFARARDHDQYRTCGRAPATGARRGGWRW
jgi:hypothetical protein